MTEKRTRHWGIDAALGAGVALGVLTLAHASLPKAAPPTRPEPTVAVAVSEPAVVRPDPILIAFQAPLPGRGVVSPFGLRQLPWEASGRLHEGVDIQAESGAPVRAAADGVVTEAGSDAGHGRYVTVRHAEGLTTLYAHLRATRAHAGDTVHAGDALGEVGSTGSSTGPHLHFEIRDARDRPLDPTLFLGRRFAEADDLPLARARKFGRTVRIAQVAVIPAARRQQMAERAAAALDAGGAGVDAAGREPIDGVKAVRVGQDGRAHARLSL